MPSLSTLVDPTLVRAAIAVDLDADILTNETIQLQIYVDPVVDAILARYPTAESATGTTLTKVATALNLLIAASFVNRIPWIKSQESDSDGYQRALPNPDKLAQDLRAQADAALSGILGESEVPTLFTLASGDRGQ